MRAIIPLVEGQGDEKAVPTLITKILSDMNRWDWYVGTPIRVGGLSKLRKQLTQYLHPAADKKIVLPQLQGIANCRLRFTR